MTVHQYPIVWADAAKTADAQTKGGLMAWLDDRVWCHPKLVDVSDRAFRVWVNGMAYSSGFSCLGRLTVGQQKTIGSDRRTRVELVGAGLWDELDVGEVVIHDWDEHNAKRDARRVADKKRKRATREADMSARKTADSPQDRSALTYEGSEGSEGSEGKALGLSIVKDMP